MLVYSTSTGEEEGGREGRGRGGGRGGEGRGGREGRGGEGRGGRGGEGRGGRGVEGVYVQWLLVSLFQTHSNSHPRVRLHLEAID